MRRPFRTIAPRICGVLLSLALGAQAQTNGPATHKHSQTLATAELFYQVLVGELSLRASDPGAAYSLMLDAARKSSDPDLFQRTVEIALQSRSGEAALQAARVWKSEHPNSRDANRFVLQILLILNRLDETIEPLRTEINLASREERTQTLLALPRVLARASSKKAAAALAERALAPHLEQAATGMAAWTALGRLRLEGGDIPGAREALSNARRWDDKATPPLMLALNLAEAGQRDIEASITSHLTLNTGNLELRLGWARWLLNSQRPKEAKQELLLITRMRPDLAEPWLTLGTLHADDSEWNLSKPALLKYLELAGPETNSDNERRGLTQAHLTLSRIAEAEGDEIAAKSWLDRLDQGDKQLMVQARKASLLIKSGRMNEGRELIQAVPVQTADELKSRQLAEMQILREHKHYREAYDVLKTLSDAQPDDTDLRYDLAMLADKLGRPQEMELLLREIMRVRPDYHHAPNALGYSLADRNQRLDEALQLIRRALELAPNDPFIQDSLGWVEYRRGNVPQAVQILEAAYQARPDAEIAAHLGEVLWTAGQRDRARKIWQEGLQLAPNNETLRDTLRRFEIQP